MRTTRKLFVTLAVFAAALGSGRSAEPKPVGTWSRQCGPVRITLKFTGNRLTAKAVVSATKEQKATTISLDADYSINPEGIVYGLVTGIDADDPDLAADLQMLAGHTFAARCRVDGDTLSIRDVKCLGVGVATEPDDELMAGILMAAGRYQRDEGKRPAQPKKVKTPKRTKGVALRPMPHRPMPIAPPVQPTAGVLLDGPVIASNPYPLIGMPTGNLAVIPTDLVSQPAPATVKAFAFPRPTGEWVRDIHSKGVLDRRIRLKLTDNHLVLTIMGVVKNRPYLQTIDADYSITKDGLVFGVITSASANIPMDSDESADEKLSQLTDQFLSFRFRLDDGALTIKDMKMPTTAGQISGRECRFLMGRYVPTSDAQPTATGGITLPSGRYLQYYPYPQYFPPEPAFPLQRELNKREVAPMPRPVDTKSEDYRQLREYWRTFWFNDNPNPVTPERIHGGIM